MRRAFEATALCLVLTMSVPVSAANRTNTAMTATVTETTTPATSVLSDSERARARVWDLTEAEWQRYRQLLQGIRGSISPNTLSPIEVLGIHAQDDAERQRYAERWARAMHEDAQRILAFQYSYDAAVRRLYPGEPLIDPARLPETSEKSGDLQSGDRVLFFTRTACPVCDALLGKLLRRIDDIAGIDINHTGAPNGDDTAVRDWAKDHAIHPEWVRSRRVTLNHDAGALVQLTQGEGRIPFLMRRREATVSPLRAADL
jgi:integrating conjugative element protein (TIGR03759 family)